MKRYRLMLFDNAACLHAGHWFHANDDEQALWLAEQLQEACSDVCTSFVLREGSREIAHTDAATPPQSPAEMSERRQQILVFHEEVLLESAFHIEQSRRLLDRLREVKRF